MTSDSLLIIFSRNPELGKVKTRLASEVGDRAALDIYHYLLDHTRKVTHKLQVSKEVHFSERIPENDLWDPQIYGKRPQVGANLGERMANAFDQAFERGFKKVVLIGSDLSDLTEDDLKEAFRALSDHDAVIGPAEDGGYYLIGLTRTRRMLFENKPWGSSKVLEETLSELSESHYQLLQTRNDVDHLSDIRDRQEFAQFLTHLTHDKGN